MRGKVWNLVREWRTEEGVDDRVFAWCVFALVFAVAAGPVVRLAVTVTGLVDVPVTGEVARICLRGVRDGPELFAFVLATSVAAVLWMMAFTSVGLLVHWMSHWIRRFRAWRGGGSAARRGRPRP